MYFSRAQIPYNFKNKKINYFKDLSVISFKPNALQNFAKCKPSLLEITEGIELLRALENDLSIGTFISKGSSFGVNIKQDFLKAVSLMPKINLENFINFKILMFFSIIIPTYNNANFLKKTLESIKNQTADNYELIIIDNHSTDETKSIVENSKINRLLYKKIKNYGVIAKSRNFGIKIF